MNINIVSYVAAHFLATTLPRHVVLLGALGLGLTTRGAGGSLQSVQLTTKLKHRVTASTFTQLPHYA